MTDLEKFKNLFPNIKVDIVNNNEYEDTDFISGKLIYPKINFKKNPLNPYGMTDIPASYGCVQFISGKHKYKTFNIKVAFIDIYSTYIYLENKETYNFYDGLDKLFIIINSKKSKLKKKQIDSLLQETSEHMFNIKTKNKLDENMRNKKIKKLNELKNKNKT